MKKEYKDMIKMLSRKSWLMYKIMSYAIALYGKISFVGGIKIYKSQCVRLNKYIIGKGNVFNTGSDCIVDHLNLRIQGNNNTITIGKNCKIGKNCAIWIIGNNCKVTIGDDTRISPCCAIEVQEDNQHISIGKDNLWSHHVRLRNNDSHYIYDAVSGKRTNFPKPIIIESHVWIAAHVTVLKGVTIGNGSVIGTHALVTKSVPANSVAAGVPAKVLQTNIEWSDEPQKNI